MVETAWRWEGRDLVLSLHVQPGARQSGWAGLHGPALKIRLQAPAVDGAANAALCAFLAEALHLPPKSISLRRGEKNRAKLVRISAPPATVTDLLDRLISVNEAS